VKPGDRIALSFDPERLYVFDQSGRRVSA